VSPIPSKVPTRDGVFFERLYLPLQRHRLSGRLIVFEGADGSGKTTLVKAALDFAQTLGRRAVEVQALDDFVRFSPMMRKYAQHPADPQTTVDILALSLTCAGSRLQNTRSTVLSELALGSWVFCDRYVFTTWAEFVNLRGICPDGEVLREVLSLFPMPDLAFLAFAHAETCISRVRGRPEEVGKVFDVDYNRRLIATYRAVGAAQGFTELSTQDRSRRECEDLIADALVGMTHTGPRNAGEPPPTSRRASRQ